MNDKEKQIEQMAKDIVRSAGLDVYGKAQYYHEQGYRKIPEGSVVLSREEYEKLTAPRVFIKPRQLNSEELAKKLKDFNYGIIGVDKSSVEIIPTRAEIQKETAEKILKAVLEDVGEFYAGDIVEELAKQFGVEVEV